MRIGFAAATAAGEGERSRFFLVDFDRERLRECCETFLAALSFDFATFDREIYFVDYFYFSTIVCLITTSATTSVAIFCVSTFTARRRRGTRARR